MSKNIITAGIINMTINDNNDDFMPKKISVEFPLLKKELEVSAYDPGKIALPSRLGDDEMGKSVDRWMDGFKAIGNDVYDSKNLNNVLQRTFNWSAVLEQFHMERRRIDLALKDERFEKSDGSDELLQSLRPVQAPFLCGAPGNGKTTIAKFIASCLPIEFFDSQELHNRLLGDSGRYRQSEEDSLMECDLIIDDLGSENWNRSWSSCPPLGQFLRARHLRYSNSGKRTKILTMITTHLTESELIEFYSKVIFDRICEMTFLVLLESPSRREGRKRRTS